MALIVEDGTGVAGAESYASVDDYIAYHETRGHTISPSILGIEQILRRATDYMETRWGLKWIGIRQTWTQTLAWPRLSAYYPDDGRPATGVPIEVKRACMEYAYRALTDELAPDPTYSTISAPLLETEDRVGPIMERRKYGAGGAQTTYRKYPIVDESLKPLLSGSGWLERV